MGRPGVRTADRLQVTRIHELLAAVDARSRTRRGGGSSAAGLAETKRRVADGGERTRRGGGDGLRSSGLIEDPETGRRRAVWALIIVLTYSRHSFVWPTFSQKLVDVIEGLEAAWAFFEGVPNYLVIDNFPAAVAGVDPLHPRLTRGFLEYSQHRGFISDPARHPRDKPRVERGVNVRERFFKGGEFTGLSDMRLGCCSVVPGGGRTEDTRHHPQAAPRRSATRSESAGRRALRDDRLAHGQGPPRPLACQRPLLGALCPTCPPGQKVEVRLSSKLVRIREDWVHPRQDRGGRSTGRLPSRAERLHPQSAGADQAQRGVTENVACRRSP